MRLTDQQLAEFDDQGYLTIGFAGHQPALADWYSNAGSMYLASLSLLALDALTLCLLLLLGQDELHPLQTHSNATCVDTSYAAEPSKYQLHSSQQKHSSATCID